MTNRLFTLNHLAKIINNSADPKCWFCKKFEETVDHLVSGCPIMTPNEYLLDMIGSKNRFTGKYVNTIMHHMLRTGTNISQRKFSKQYVQEFYGISLFIQTEQYK